MKKAKILLLVLLGVGTCAGLSSSQTVFEAARKGDIAVLKAILQGNPPLVSARGEIGRSPLQEALLAGQSEAARFLVEAA